MSAGSNSNSRRLFAAFLFLIALLFLGPSQARAAAAAAATSTTLEITVGTKVETSVSSGTAVSLIATVKSGSSAVQAGQVIFCDAEAAHCTDIHVLGVAELTTAGIATFKFVPSPGTHSYKALFHGTATDTASTSVASALTVSGAPTITTIAQSGGVGNYTLKATVTANGSAAGPTGKVSFLDTSNNNAVLGTAELGTATEAFTWTSPQSPATALDPHSLVVADFNGDGIPDIAIGSNGTSASKDIGSINILLGKGDGTFQAATTFAGLTGDQLIVAAPFVTGGPQDILAVNNSSATTSNGLLFLGDGKGGLGAGVTLSVGIDTITALITGDFNSDGKIDLAVSGQVYGIPCFIVILGNGDGTFGSGLVVPTSNVPITALGAGDFTGQGALDIAAVHSDGTVDIFLQDGSGNFYPSSGTQSGSSPTAIAIGDFNGDGKADLAITNSAQGTISILLGDGSGGFKASASPVTGSLPSAIAVGDFNGDGIADLAVANSGANTVTLLLGKGDGTFTAEPELNAGNTPVSLAIGDFNGQGTADIAVANEDPSSSGSTSTATVLLSRRTQSATATASGVAPAYPGANLVDASYAGDTIYHASISTTTSITGSGKQAVAPILSPAAGTYSTPQTITLTDTTPGATIYYTTNGTTPTTASTRYTAAISVTSTETFEAIAVASGYASSAVATATYTIAADSELQFIPITPCRIADTRNAAGAFGGPELAATVTRTFNIPHSACSIPTTAAAYSLNVTVVPIASLGYLTVWPAGQSQPAVSTLNSDGRVKANATIMPAGTSGGVSVYASDATQFILDIDGYFVPAGTSTAGLEFFPLTPCRIADTRNANGALGGPSLASATSRAFPVQSSNCGVPATAKAYSLNVTAVPHQSLGFLTAWPTGEAQPGVSTLNASTGVVTANAAILPAGTGGDVSIYVSDASDVILDINGYFAPAATGGLSLYTVAPCRVIDTRNSSSFNGTLTIPVKTSSCAPPAAAKEYVLNATALPVGSLGYLSLWAAGASQPAVSTLNASDGVITSNMAIVPTSNGSINAYAASQTNLLIDISSYFAP